MIPSQRVMPTVELIVALAFVSVGLVIMAVTAVPSWRVRWRDRWSRARWNFGVKNFPLSSFGVFAFGLFTAIFGILAVRGCVKIDPHIDLFGCMRSRGGL
jgi:hypothetical protein